MKVWHFPQTKLWQVLLQAHVTNLNAHTLLHNGPTGTDSLNSLYFVSSTTKLLNHIEDFTKYIPSSMEVINTVYQLPYIKLAVRYLHGAAGFPTKETCIKIIRMGNYLTWPLRTVNNASKFLWWGNLQRRGDSGLIV